MSDLATLEKSILEQIAAAGDEAALEAVRVAALGKKGTISALLATLGKMSPDDRKTQGAAINLAKDKVTEALAARKSVLARAALDARLASEHVDITLPARHELRGTVHPVSQVWEEVVQIFGHVPSGAVPLGRPFRERLLADPLQLPGDGTRQPNLPGKYEHSVDG